MQGAVRPSWLITTFLTIVVMAASPVVAQDDLDLDEYFDTYDNLFAFDPPLHVARGTTLTLSGGVRPDTCQPGTTEFGFDPAPQFEDAQHDDYRSGQQVAVSIPDSGPFTAQLSIPSDATDGFLYVTCDWVDGFEPGDQTSEWRAVRVSDAAPVEPQPSEARPSGATAGSSEEPEEDDFRFEMRAGTSELSGTGQAAAPLAPAVDEVVLAAPSPDSLFAAGPTPLLAEAPPQAVRLPDYARCNVSTCLWGYFAHPYFNCNQTVVTVNFGLSRYGSMTAYGYVRKGLADYILARPLFYQDGQLIRTGDWVRKEFFYPIGQPWESWIGLKIHQQFASPQSTYQVAFQARWYDDVAWGRDRQLAATGRVSPVPYLCVAGP